jgi:hypothetical protein
MEIAFRNKTLTVAGGVITIVTAGNWLVSRCEKTIHIRDVTSVEVKKPGRFSDGFIQFSVAGGRVLDNSKSLDGGVLKASLDENSVMLGGDELYEIALKIKAYVEALSPPAPPAPPAMSADDEMRELKARELKARELKARELKAILDKGLGLVSGSKTLTVAGGVITIVTVGEKELFDGFKEVSHRRREKTILIRNVTSVEVKKSGGLFGAGFIQFSIAGGIARDSSYTLTGGSWSAAGDENSVMLGSSDELYERALKIKAYVEAWSPNGEQPPQPAVSAADEIRKMKVLLDEGLLTDEEFTLKKKQLLGL